MDAIREQTVLIADNFASVRNVVELALIRTFPGLRMIHAANGIQALLKLGAVIHRRVANPNVQVQPDDVSMSPSPVTAVVTDFQMPELTGLHILHLIRTGCTGVPRHTPVTMLTG